MLLNHYIFHFTGLLIFTAGLSSCAQAQDGKPVPVILVSDLYHPGQDVGDNFDIITPYALPQIDLRGVIFDVTQRFRNESAPGAQLREPGFIPVTQLNCIFGREVPCACSPFTPMRSPDDRMEDAPQFQQAGLDLFFRLLRESSEPITVVSTGSCRILAVAYNREPQLMLDKITAIHLSAGASSDTFREWNIELDTLAAYRLLSSDLRINIYPCATAKGPFDKGVNNTFWSLDDLGFVFEMNPMLRNYAVYAFLHKNRTDFLNFLEGPLDPSDEAAFRDYRVDRMYGSGGCHYVWETSLWQQAAGLVLAQRTDSSWRFVPREELTPEDYPFDEGLEPVGVRVDESGLFRFTPTKESSNFRIYRRADPELHQRALRQALPALYKSFCKPHLN